jgi:hypothetical protein
MTEQEWLACEDPRAMLRFLKARTRPRFRKRQTLAEAGVQRRLRLWSCACWHGRWWHLPDGSKHRVALEQAARWADRPDAPMPREALAYLVGSPDAFHGAEATAWGLSEDNEGMPQSRQADLLRCLFGNPFRPVSPGPWVTPAAATVARDVYDRRDFAALPLLADLLEEAGCPEQSVLDHCRTPGEHARGCWAVDLVLGRS